MPGALESRLFGQEVIVQQQTGSIPYSHRRIWLLRWKRQSQRTEGNETDDEEHALFHGHTAYCRATSIRERTLTAGQLLNSFPLPFAAVNNVGPGVPDVFNRFGLVFSVMLLRLLDFKLAFHHTTPAPRFSKRLTPRNIDCRTDVLEVLT